MAETYTSNGQTYTRPSTSSSNPTGVSFGGSPSSGGSTSTAPKPSGSSSSGSSSSNPPLTNSGSSFRFMDNSEYDKSGKQTVAPTSITPANSPVTTSAPARGSYAALYEQIDKLSKANSESTAGSSYAALITDRQKQLADRKKTEINQINSNYSASAAKQQQGQKSEVGTNSMGLARIGGFDSASGQAVLTNLARTHEDERQALMAKRDGAIQQANQAFEDKDFSLAEMQIKEAKETEQRMYDREKDLINFSLQMKGEERADAQIEMQKQRDQAALREAAFEFNYNNNVKAPFIMVDGKTVLRANTHEPLTEEQFFAETGYSSWDQVPQDLIQAIQKPVGGLDKDKLIQGKDGWYDISGSIPKLIIPESPSLQVISQRTNPQTGESENVYGSYNVNTRQWEEAAVPSSVAVNPALNKQFVDGAKGGQCGQFANSLVDLPFTQWGDPLASKKQKVDQYGMSASTWRSGVAVAGDTIVTSENKDYGHVSVVMQDNGDGTVTVKDSNYNLDEKIQTRVVRKDMASIYGVIRAPLKSGFQGEQPGGNVTRNPKIDGKVYDIIKNASNWGEAADQINFLLGNDKAAAAYDLKLKERFYIPDEAFKFNTAHPPKSVDDWQNSRNDFVQQMASQGLDKGRAGEEYDKWVKKPTGTSADSSALTRDYFRSLYPGTTLDAAAKAAGYTNNVKWGRDTANTEGYLDYIMNTIESYRKAGYTDKEILEKMKPKK